MISISAVKSAVPEQCKTPRSQKKCENAVAVIQTAFIGDVVLATPLFESARLSNPDKNVIAVVRAGCENLIENNPNIDRIIVWDKHGSGKGLRGILSLAGELKKEGTEIILIPHRSFRTALAAVLSGAKIRIGFAKGGGAFLHNRRIHYPTGIHEVERNLLLAKSAGWIHEKLKPAIYPDDSDRQKIDRILYGSGKFCVIAPGSVWPTKRWRPEYYIEAGKALAGKGFKIFVSGGQDDVELCAHIAVKVPGATDVSGKLSLRQSYELYRRSEFVLTCDSAPQHIAAASGTRVFSIFGPTVRDFGFWPYSPRGAVIEESMDCRPCGIHGHNKCPLGTHACMRSISYIRLLDIIDKELKNEKPVNRSVKNMNEK